jgi:hypothetical protein
VDGNNLAQKSRALALTKRSYVAGDFAYRRSGIVLAAGNEFKTGSRCIFQADGSPLSDYIARRCNMRDAFLSLRGAYITAPIIYLARLLHARAYHLRAGPVLLPQLPRANTPIESRSIADAREELYLSFARIRESTILFVNGIRIPKYSDLEPATLNAF